MRRLFFISLLMIVSTAAVSSRDVAPYYSAMAEFDLSKLQPGDKALLDETFNVLEDNAYILGAEETVNNEGVGVWTGYEDRLHLLSWLDAVSFAADKLHNNDAMSIFRVGNLMYEYFCKNNNLVPPEGDFALIYMVTFFCSIPIGNEEDIRADQFTLNMISGTNSISQTFDALRFFATLDWGKTYDKNQLQLENQAWYEVKNAYRDLYVNCIMEGTMGPLLINSELSAIAFNRSEILTAYDDIQDEIYIEDSNEPITDEEFFAMISPVTEYSADYYNPGFAQDAATRQSSYDAFVDAWNKWQATRRDIAETSLQNNPAALKAFDESVNELRYIILRGLNIIPDEYEEGDVEEEAVG